MKHEELLTQNGKLSIDLNSARKRFKEAGIKIKMLYNQVQNLQERNSKIEAENKDHRTNLADKTTLISQIEQEIQTWKEWQTETFSNPNSLLELVSDLIIYSKSKAQNLLLAQEKINECQNKCDFQDKEIYSKASIIEEQKEHNKSLEEIITKKTSCNNDLSSEIRSLESKNADLEESRANYEKELREKSIEIGELKDLLARLEGNVSFLKTKLTKLESDLKLREEQNIVFQNDIKKLVEKKAILSAEVKSLNNSIHESEKVILKKESDFIHLQQRQELAEAKEKQIEKQLDSMQNELQLAHTMKIQNDIDLRNFQKEIEILSGNQIEKDQMLVKLQAELTEEKRCHSDGLKTQNKLSVSLDQLKNFNEINCQSLKEKSVALESAQEKIKEYISVNEELEKSKSSLAVDCVELKFKLDAEQNEKASLEREVSKLVETIEKLRKQESIISSETAELSSKLNGAIEDAQRLQISEKNIATSYSKLQSEYEQIKIDLCDKTTKLTECIASKQESQNLLLIAKKENEMFSQMERDSKTLNIAQTATIQRLTEEIIQLEQRFLESQQKQVEKTDKLQSDLSDSRVNHWALEEEISLQKTAVSASQQALKLAEQENQEKDKALKLHQCQLRSLELEHAELQTLVEQLQVEQRAIEEKNSIFLKENQEMASALENQKSIQGKF